MMNLFPDSWNEQRKIIVYLQHFLNKRNPETKQLVEDGYYGGQTDFVFVEYLDGSTLWRTDDNSTDDIKTDYPNYNGIEGYYGRIKDVQGEIVTVKIPYAHYLSWSNQKVTKVSCHKKISEPYLNILTEVLETYGEKDIVKLGLDKFGGSYTSPPRIMRGGSKYSTHCWGIAFDYDPDHNQLRWGRDKASFAKPDYSDWMNIWKKYGATNLGIAKNYDWMHFQFSRV